MTTTDELAAAAGERFDPPPPPAPVAKLFAVEGSHAAPRPPAKSLTAAAKVIDVTTREGVALLRRPEGWQETVWEILDQVPEAKFAQRFVGNALSRVRLYPGIVVDPSEPPVDLHDAVEHEDIRLDPQLAADAQSETDRIMSGPDGHAGMMRGFGELLSTTGDALVIGRDARIDDPTLDEELWGVYSPQALAKSPSGDGLVLRETPGDKGVPLVDATVYRIYRHHPRWRGLADANMRAVISICEELLLMGRAMRSTIKSRNPAGLLLIPDQLDPEHGRRGGRARPGTGDDVPFADTAAAQQAGGAWTEFETRLIRSLISPVEDDGSAAAVVPHILKGKAELLEKIRHISMGRTVDVDAVARMEHLIRRLAHGVDLPVEVLTGMADANHWTGWQIEDSTYKAHIEPTAQIPAAGLAAVHLRPALVMHGHPVDVVRRITYGIDPSGLVVRPNRAQDARAAYEALALSKAAYLRYLGFPESDAPDEIELATRYVLERGIGGQDITAQLWNLLRMLPPEAIEGNENKRPLILPGLLAGEPEAAGTGTPADGAPPAEDPDDDGGEGGGEPTPAQPVDDAPDDGGDDAPSDDQASTPAVTAAAGPVAGLGRQLADIEAWARAKLLAEAESAMRRALDRAGSRLRGKVQGDPALAAEVKGQPAAEVGRILGADRAPVVDVDELLAGAWDGLAEVWDQVLAAAESQMADAVERATGVDVTDVVVAAGHPAEEAALAQGLESLRLGMHAVAGPRIFAMAEAAAEGETDITSSIPSGIVRDALAVAGGGRAGVAPTGPVSQAGPPGLTTGVRWRAKLTRAGVSTAGYTWRNGISGQPFPPHRSLDGTVFTTWDDDVLANHGRFPSTGHFYPGDHRGCTCDAVPTMVRTGTPPEPEPEVAPAASDEPDLDSPLGQLRAMRSDFAGTEQPLFTGRIEADGYRRPTATMALRESARHEIGDTADRLIADRLAGAGLDDPAALRATADEATDRYQELLSSHARRRGELDEAGAPDSEHLQLAIELEDARETMREALSAADAAEQAWAEGWQAEVRRVMDEMGVARGGVDPDAVFANANAIDPAVRASLTGALENLPASWGQAAARHAENKGKVFVSVKPGRAFYRPATDRTTPTLQVSATESRNVVFHEWAHHMEEAVDDVKGSEWVFYWRRVGDDELRPMNDFATHGHYRPDEAAREDEFANAYMGKEYPSFLGDRSADSTSAYELLSMATEVYAGPWRSSLEVPWSAKAWRDEDMRRWYLALLLTA